MSAGVLQIGGSVSTDTPSFVQQGQIDWVAFGNTAWTATSVVLQRFASAGVQPVTYGAGIALASQFHLDHLGQQRMDQALERLRGIPLFHKLLWLGFGYQSLIDSLAKTAGGIKCVALCSCLADVHSEESAAWVLAELWKASKYPYQYEPSHSQFVALVKACAGVVAQTQFGRTVDRMLGDNSMLNNTLWAVSSDTRGSLVEASNARDIAGALHGLFQISKGEVEDILVTGGAECAFIAALGHWLFNFNVYVENEQQQSIYPPTGPPNVRRTQVHVRYGEISDHSLQVTSRTYILKKCSDVFDRIPDNQERLLIVRTPWDGCLSRAFGPAFRSLADMPLHLGSYLGSVARVYSALAQGHDNVGSLSRIHFARFDETNYGYGFIHTILETFPELDRIQGLRNMLQSSADLPFGEALKSVEQSILALEQLCTCYECRFSSDEDSDNSRSCLVGMSYAIREIAWTMASVVQDSPDHALLPSVEGIRGFSRYGKTKLYHQDTEGNYRVTDKGSWDRSSFAKDALGLKEKGDLMQLNHPLYGPSLLFQGPELPGILGNLKHLSQVTPNITALSSRGVCIYMDGLRDLTCQAELVHRVYVLPGHIYYRERQYNYVQDFDVLDSKIPGLSDIMKLKAQIEPATKTVPEATLGMEKSLKVDPLAAELASEKAISCSYKIYNSDASLRINPGKLAMQVLWRSGNIVCQRKRCKSMLAFPCSVVKRGWAIQAADKPQGLTYFSRIACCIWPHQDELMRCVALATHFGGEGMNAKADTVFVRRRECLPCCSLSILKESSNILADEYPEGKVVVHII